MGNFEVSSTRRARWILAGIFFLALFLRFLGLKGSLPYVTLPDEEYVVVNAMRLGRQHLRPSSFLYPSFYLYLSFLEYIVFFVAGRVTGAFHGSSDFAHYFFENITPFYMSVRVTTVVFGILTIFLVYYMNRKRVSENAGLWAALFLAVSPLHVFRSHFAGADVPMVFFVTLSFYFMAEVLEKPVRKNFVLSGIAIGMAIGTKYNAGLLVLPYGVLYLLLLKKGRSFMTNGLNWFLGGICVPIVFFATSPFILLHPVQFWHDIYGPIFLYPSIGAPEMGNISSGWWFYLFRTLPEGMGVPLTLIVLLSIFMVFFRKRKEEWLYVSFIIPYYLSIGHSRSLYNRFLLPVFPLLFILAGRMIDEVLRSKSRWIRGCGYALTVAAVLFSMKIAAGSSYMLSREDLSLSARAWIMENIPDRSSILLDKGAPQIPLSKSALKRKQRDVKRIRNKGGRGTHIKYLLGLPEPRPSFDALRINPFQPEMYRETKISEFDYYVLDAFSDYRFRVTPGKFATEVAFYKNIRKQARRIKKFNRKPYQPGPEWIEILKRR